MKKRIKQIMVLSLLVLIGATYLVGCSKGDKVKEDLESYKKAWISNDYEGMYEMLSKESKEYISKEEFIKRYKNIYSAIGSNSIKIDFVEDKKQSDSLEEYFKLSMNTIAGNLEFDNVKVSLVKEDDNYKIKWNESLILPEMQPEDKVRVKIDNAKRGSILDRNDNLLASDGVVSLIGIHPSVFEKNKEANIKKMAQILDISESKIEEKLNKNKNPENLVPIVDIAKYEEEKIQSVSTIEGVKVKDKNSRVYIQGEAHGNLLGYVGPVTKEELENNAGKGYSAYSYIGKNGLEKIYEEKLRAKDGVHIYIERGDNQVTIAKTEAVNGKDIKLSIDSDLQNKIYSEMKGEKGASTALHPKTGEVLAMVSSPSYDSNTLVTYKTKTQDENFKKSENAQFLNRANDVYSPGSTFKLVTAAIGLEVGVINPEESMDIKGLNWQKDNSWGKYKVTRVKDTNGPIDFKDAVKYSDNIYFADKALKIGKDKFISISKKFGIGEDLKFEYPMEKSKIANEDKIDKEVLLADTGYGQGQVMMTPLDVALVYSALGNDGNIMNPRLVISDNKEAILFKEAINPKYLPILLDSFSAVINDNDGTGNPAKIEGINIAGKTGTAEIKKTKEDTSGSQNGWFVAVNTDDPKVVISMIIEDVKDKGGSNFVIPMVKNTMEYYLKK